MNGNDDNIFLTKDSHYLLNNIDKNRSKNKLPWKNKYFLSDVRDAEQKDKQKDSDKNEQKIIERSNNAQG